MNRPLDRRERETLDHLLSIEFPGRDELRAQGATLRVVRKCGCGCASIYVQPDRTASPPAKAEDMSPVGAQATSGPWYVHLLVRDGYLADVEIYAVTGEPPPAFPAPSELEPPDIFPHGRHSG